MRVLVNGVHLFFDVEGAGLMPDGPIMREKPTLLLLHGGPGFDHSIYKPAYSSLADCAQIIYLDHRGNGRSDGLQSTNRFASCRHFDCAADATSRKHDVDCSAQFVG